MSISEKIRQHVLSSLPKEVEITRIEYEGPRISIYTKNPEILAEQGFLVADIVKMLRKRIVIRSDPSVRLEEEKARKIIMKLVPKEAGVEDVYFDPAFGDVIIEAKKVGLVVGKNGRLLHDIIKETKWRPYVLREPPIASRTVKSMLKFISEKSSERGEILRQIGERVFRPQTYVTDYISITGLGGFREVGRSAILVRTAESNVLLDCGINPGLRKPTDAFPRFDDKEFDLSALDAVIISHAHLDHCGFLPFLYKHGYSGPVYCSSPTFNLMTLLQLDYLDVLRMVGSPQPYSERDVRKMILHTITMNYGEVNDIAPDVRLTLHNAGHILGSSIIHLHIGEGIYNIVYTGDFKFGETELLERASVSFPRAETLVMESTYGAPTDVMPRRSDSEGMLVDIINQTIDRGGKVLIPVPAVGRAQEIMIVLNKCMREGGITEVPIFIEGMVAEATAIHTAFPGWLSTRIRNSILIHDENPFKSDYFTIIKHPSEREEVISGGPCIILATNGMLVGGPVLDYFRQLAVDERNSLIFVSYQIEGTIGSRVEHGLKEVSVVDDRGKMRMVKVNCNVASIGGFSGHSDRKQIVGYVGRITPRPKRVVVCHGERSKSINLARALHRIYGVGTSSPVNLETIRLR